MLKRRGETAELQRLDQIPPGMTEDETDRFWETHSLSEELLEQMEPFPDDFPLPPREASQEPTVTESGESSQMLPIGKIMLGGVAVVGLLTVGYLAYRAMRGDASVGFFEPTGVPT